MTLQYATDFWQRYLVSILWVSLALSPEIQQVCPFLTIGAIQVRLGKRETFKKFQSYGDPLVTGSMGKREKEGKREENFQNRGRKKRGEKEEKLQ